MRKRAFLRPVRYFLALFIALMAAVWLTAPVYAASRFSDYGLEEEYREWMAGIPESVRPYLPPELCGESDAPDGTETETEGGTVGDGVAEMVTFPYIADALGRVLSVEWGTAVKILATVTGLLTLYAAVAVVLDSLTTDSPGLVRVAETGMTVGLYGVLLETLWTQVERVGSFLDGLQSLTVSLCPMLTALHVLGGNTAVAAAQNGGLMIFLSVCETLCNRTVMPMAALSLSAALMEALSPQVAVGGLMGVIKSHYTKAMGLLMLILGFVMSAQTALSAATDSVGARAAKFVSVQLIPMTGGMVGDSLRMLSSGVRYLKSTVGVGAVAVMLLLLLPVAVSLMLIRFSLGLCGGVAELLGRGREKKLLDQFGGVCGMLLSVVALCSVLFVLSMVLFVRTAVAVG